MTSRDSRLDDSELDRRLDALTRVGEPPSGSWSAIERRIRRRRWPGVLSAGFAAAAVLSGVALVVSQIGPAPTPTGGIAETTHAEVRAMRASARSAACVAALHFDEGAESGGHHQRQADDRSAEIRHS